MSGFLFIWIIIKHKLIKSAIKCLIVKLCFGHTLRDSVLNVSGEGTVKADFILTKNIEEVCVFLSVPHNSLDGRTRLSCPYIFQVRVHKNCKTDSKMEWESGGGKGGPGPSNIWKNRNKCVFYQCTG